MRVSRYHGATISSRKLCATISSYSEVRDDIVRHDHTIRALVCTYIMVMIFLGRNGVKLPFFAAVLQAFHLLGPQLNQLIITST